MGFPDVPRKLSCGEKIDRVAVPVILGSTGEQYEGPCENGHYENRNFYDRVSENGHSKRSGRFKLLGNLKVFSVGRPTELSEVNIVEQLVDQLLNVVFSLDFDFQAAFGTSDD